MIHVGIPVVLVNSRNHKRYMVVNSHNRKRHMHLY